MNCSLWNEVNVDRKLKSLLEAESVESVSDAELTSNCNSKAYVALETCVEVEMI